MRGTFANIRLRNLLVPGSEGNVTVHFAERRADVDLRRVDEVPGREDAARRPRGRRVRHGLLARLGREGHDASRRARPSSRRASSASTARTSRAWASSRSSSRPARTRRPSASPAARRSRSRASPRASAPQEGHGHGDLRGRQEDDVHGPVRLDTPNEVDYYRHGGILTYVLRQLAAA